MKKLMSILLCGLTIIGLTGCGLTDSFKKGYNDADKSDKYVGINIKEIKELPVTNGSKDKEIGKRGVVTYNPDKITDESLSNFYKDKIKDSGYNYYTLVSEKDKKQGIISAGCMSILTYGEIDDTGSLVKGNKDFEVK